MHFNSISDFLHMGGYAPYVWTAYGIAALVLISNVVIPWRQKIKLLNKDAEKYEPAA